MPKKNPSKRGIFNILYNDYCNKFTPPTVAQAPVVMFAPVAVGLVVY
jgi:hypothetical protein